MLNFISFLISIKIIKLIDNSLITVETSNLKTEITVTKIIKSPYQFSVWNKNSKVDPRAIKPEDDSYRTALKVIEGITSSKYKDPTGGASYYWNPNVAKRKSWMSPAEAENKLTIGKHTFAGLASNPFKYIYKPVKK